jgi:dTDP-4-amino-4,6-dideoxygalactose transaminase
VEWAALLSGLTTALSGDGAGRRRESVEALIASHFAAERVLLTDSGTSALRLAIAGATSGRRPVAIPAYSCYDIATAVEGADADAVLYDLDPYTLAPEAESLAQACSHQPGAIVVCHLFGHLVDLRPVREVVGEVPIIEDAAQGVGGRVHGQRLGALGSTAVLSFGRGKGLTGGGGGALLGHDSWGVEVVERVASGLSAPSSRGLGALIALLAQMILGRPSLYGIPAALPFLHLGETRYHEPWPPAGAPLGSLAVLGHVLRDVDRGLESRTRTAQRLERALAHSERAGAIRPVEDGTPGYLRLPALLRDKADPAIASLLQHGVARGYPAPLSDLPVFGRRTVAVPENTPGARALADRLITLPTHALVREGDLAAIEAWLRHD